MRHRPSMKSGWTCGARARHRLCFLGSIAGVFCCWKHLLLVRDRGVIPAVSPEALFPRGEHPLSRRGQRSGPGASVRGARAPRFFSVAVDITLWKTVWIMCKSVE